MYHVSKKLIKNNDRFYEICNIPLSFFYRRTKKKSNKKIGFGTCT